MKAYLQGNNVCRIKEADSTANLIKTAPILQSDIL